MSVKVYVSVCGTTYLKIGSWNTICSWNLATIGFVLLRFMYSTNFWVSANLLFDRDQSLFGNLLSTGFSRQLSF